ncbi:MAG: bifunctional phosphopantothenoylcysteine decarboxylase/phosphopantothenate--cysteine ligase CoaBC [Betaproteobacteria bacterium]|nr:MAG: bifunctional phosphopantothenoylcysteine decarboxylase/phosphopantothenate--cysteine ligase CoaBC [Betaproteobacteria bacterium]
MSELAEKRILLGLTGGIAAYKAADLARGLIKQGAEVQVVMTDAACRFISPLTLQALTGKPVYTSMWDDRVGNGMPHIELSRDRDLIVVAPATADFMAKLVHGTADDLLATLCIARECPLMVAPAMNRQMWENPATRRNVKQLSSDGIIIEGPASGDQACGENGMGRMSEPDQIVESIVSWFQPKLLAGARILVTAGPTYEPIDAVRGITNLSSGRMGYAVARAAHEAGAKVTLISGRTGLQPPANVSVIDIITAQQMHDEVMERLSECDILIAVAAVADYRVSNREQHKIKKKAGAGLTLELEPNPDILGSVAAHKDGPFCVGFSAESQNIESHAAEKRRRKNIPLIAANLVQAAFGSEQNELILIDDEGAHRLPRSSKLQQARGLIRHITRLYKPGRKSVTAR